MRADCWFRSQYWPTLLAAHPLIGGGDHRPLRLSESDAITAGWNRSYAAVVWVGRFDGRSDAALLGAATAEPILGELLFSPRLATTRSPRAVPRWPVVQPVGRAQERPLLIPEPRDGDVLVATTDVLSVTPKVRTRTSRAVLFVDGVPLRESSVNLSPGQHEFRLVELGEIPHAITINVVLAHR